MQIPADPCEEEAGVMKIAFVYAGGRERCLASARAGESAADFFYGAIELARTGHEVSVIDLNPEPCRAVRMLDAGLARWLPPKTYFSDIGAARRELVRLREADAVVATASGCAFALGICKRLGWLPSGLVGIHCGIVNHPHSLPRRWVAGHVLRGMSPVLFADNEAAEMARQYGDCGARPLWFGVDHEFWTPPPGEARRQGVLAVGNDGRRDYATLISAARLLPDVPFQIVTRRELGADLPANVKHMRGDWKADALSDADLRSLYRSAACVAVPLTESIQPSGQSVAMQAMMCATPVVMTRTSGWWGKDVLSAGLHLRDARPGDPAALAATIRKSFDEALPRSGRQAMLDAGWTSAGFSERLTECCRLAATGAGTRELTARAGRSQSGDRS